VATTPILDRSKMPKQAGRGLLVVLLACALHSASAGWYN
jgi:hypothetical protein